MSKVIPYLMTTAVACLVVLAAWGLINLFLEPDDTLIIEVVPLADAGQIRVQVDGAVAQPGVYLLPVGSTEADAIQAAGGRIADDGPEGDPERILADGDLVLVAAVAGVSGASTGPVDINTASAAELETLPGIGPVLAARIVAYREEHGPFASTNDLAAVSGISERMVAELEGRITAGAP